MGVPDLNIRPARVGDVTAIHDLIKTFAERKLMIRRSLGELYESIREFLVAVDDDGKVIGCAALHVFWDDLAELKCLAVAEGTHGRGIGRGIDRGIDRRVGLRRREGGRGVLEGGARGLRSSGSDDDDGSRTRLHIRDRNRRRVVDIERGDRVALMQMVADQPLDPLQTRTVHRRATGKRGRNEREDQQHLAQNRGLPAKSNKDSGRTAQEIAILGEYPSVIAH